MTAAHEATVFNELNIDYALVCMVDNYANGVDPVQKLTVEKFHQLVAANQQKVEHIVGLVLRQFANSIKIINHNTKMTTTTTTTLEALDAKLEHHAAHIANHNSTTATATTVTAATSTKHSRKHAREEAPENETQKKRK
jgi:hypothetical protein